MNKTIRKLPQYETAAGSTLPIDTTVRNGYQICIKNTTVEECRAYAQLLEEKGFSLYSVKEVTAGTQNAGGYNLFYTYTTQDMHVFLSWYASLKTTRIVATPSQGLPRIEKSVMTDSDSTIPCVIQPKLQLNGGMSYVVQLADASFIVIDGGLYNPADAQCLYEILVERTSEGKRPQIAMWMFTHPHSDHIELATEFILEKAGKVDIKSFAYQFPNYKEMNTVEVDQKVGESIEQLEKNICTGYPDATIYTLHTGQTYYFKGLEMDILFTGEDIYPLQATSYNDTSAVCRMTFDNGKTMLFLGDCMRKSCQQLAQTYGDYLKSNILQVTHHGLLGGDKDLYQLIDPEICFWPVSESRFIGCYPEEKVHYCLGEGGCDYNAWLRDSNIRMRQHYHNSETTCLKVNDEKVRT